MRWGDEEHLVYLPSRYKGYNWDVYRPSLGGSCRPELFVASMPYLRYGEFCQIAFGSLPRHTLMPLLSEVLWSRGFEVSGTCLPSAQKEALSVT